MYAACNLCCLLWKPYRSGSTLMSQPVPCEQIVELGRKFENGDITTTQMRRMDKAGTWKESAHGISMRQMAHYLEKDPDYAAKARWECLVGLPPNDTPKTGGKPILGAADRMLACVCVLSSRGGFPYTPMEIKSIALLTLIELGAWCQALGKVYDVSCCMAGWYTVSIITILKACKVVGNCRWTLHY
jgi:hypothetical protein